MGPTNGVTLKIKAESAPPGDKDAIDVTWTLWYSGPRSPLMIRRPSLSDAFSGSSETELLFIIQGRSSEYSFSYTNPVAINASFEGYPPEYFLRVPGGAGASGVFRVKASEIRDTFLKYKPKEFDPLEQNIQVLLYFSPTDRGEGMGFDAWTGRVESPLTSVNWVATWPIEYFK